MSEAAVTHEDDHEDPLPGDAGEQDEAALWAEMSAERSRGDDAAAADDEAPSGDAPGRAEAPEAASDPEEDAWRDASRGDAASTTEDDDAGDDARAASGTDDDPDPESGSSEQNPDDNVWANATEEQRAAFEAAQQERARLEHQLRSDRGRLSARDRQISELQDKLRRTETGKPRPPAKEGADSDDAETETELLESEDWRTFRDEYPDVAKPVESIVSRLQSEVDRMERQLGSVGEERLKAAADEQLAILNDAHPGWDELLSQTPRIFEAWIADQPRHVREAYERNYENIVDAEEAIDVFNRYHTFIESQVADSSANADDDGPAGEGAQGQQAAGEPDTQPGQGDDAPASGNRSASGRRQAQRESAASARGRGPSVGSGIAAEGDEESIWKQMAADKRRRAAQQAGA